MLVVQRLKELLNCVNRSALEEHPVREREPIKSSVTWTIRQTQCTARETDWEEAFHFFYRPFYAQEEVKL